MDTRDLNPLSAQLPDASITKDPPAKVEEPRVKPVTSQQTELRKKAWYKRAAESIFFEDSQTIGGYIMKDVVLPAIRDTIYDVITGGLGMALYSNPKAGKANRASRAGGSLVNYGSYYSNEKTKPKALERPDKYRTQMDIYNILLEDDPDSGRRADQVGYAALEEIIECVNRYGFVTVQDLAVALNIGNIPSTMAVWGWKDVSSARVELDRGNWYFRMHAKAQPLD